MVDAADSLGKYRRNVQHVQLGAQSTVFVLRDRVGDHNLINGRVIDALYGVAAEHAVGNERIHSRGAFLSQQLSSTCDGVGGVDEIVNQDTDTIGNVAYQHHGGILSVCDARGPSFLGGLVKLGRHSQVGLPLTL